MKRLIKADLGAVLKLAPTYFPVSEKSIELDVAHLNRCDQTDHLFLVRREKSWLFDYGSVYTPDSYANLTWTYGKLAPYLPAAALALHVDQIIEGRPWGSVTILNYQNSIADVEQFSQLPLAQRERHIRLLVRHYTRHPQYCSIREMIEYLKTGEVK